LAAIPDVQRAAAARYRDFGMPEVADGPVVDEELLWRFLGEGSLFVVTRDAVAVGFVACAPLDRAAHVAEIHVAPEHARRGLGARLLERLDAWAAARDMGRLTLTTYREVPYNAPYYRRLGFRETSAAALGPEHVAMWKAQGEMGLDLSKRLLMDRPTATLRDR